MKRQITKAHTLPVAAMLVVMTVIFTVMVIWTPIRLDDYVFAGVYREITGGDAFSCRGLIDCLLNNRLYDNARLSNFCSPLSTIIEPWCTIFPYVAGIVCTSMIVLALMLTGIRRNFAAGLAIMWITCIVLLPWRDNLFTRDYILNYPCSAVLILAFVYGMCADEGQRLKRPLWFICTFIVGMIAAGWHEGFALPVGAGMGVWALSRRLRMSWQWWTIMICFGVAAFAFLICPGMINRFTQQVGEGNRSMLIKIVIQALPASLTIVASVLGLCFRSTRPILVEKFNSPVTKVIFTALVCSFAMSMTVKYTHRMAFFPTLCAIIFWGRMLAPWVESLKARKSTIITFICTVLCTAQGIAACVWQKRIYDQHNVVLPLLLKSETGTVFYDVYYPADIPAYTLFFPSRTLWYESWGFQAFDLLYTDKPHMVVPRELAHLSGRAISRDGNIYSTGKNIWLKDIPDFGTQGALLVNLRMHDGRRKDGFKTNGYRFVSAGGDTLLFIKPLHINIAEIDSMEIVSYSDRLDY